MLRYAAATVAPAPVVWSLIAEPARWSEWSPHVRGAWGLGTPEVRLGARGAARLLGAVPVPARVTALEPGRSWTWTVGPMELEHRAEPMPDGGALAVVVLRAPGRLEPVLGATYGSLVRLLVANLARVADRQVHGSA